MGRLDKRQFAMIENYMLGQMRDSAHDCQHVYRVLYLAMDIAQGEGADGDILITAALLHDVGRSKQFANPALCHAVEGGKMAFEFLLQKGWEPGRAEHVQDCIVSHRYRTNHQPGSIEAKILFDADKLEATGAMGIARTILYKGQVNQPLYSVDEAGRVLDGTEREPFSFFQEYQYKLKHVYDKFYTVRGRELAEQCRAIAVAFYDGLLDEVIRPRQFGQEQLALMLTDSEMLRDAH